MTDYLNIVDAMQVKGLVPLVHRVNIKENLRSSFNGENKNQLYFNL